MIRFGAVILVAAAACAQPIRTGQLLVATTASHDPDFARTVVLIVLRTRTASPGYF